MNPLPVTVTQMYSSVAATYITVGDIQGFHSVYTQINSVGRDMEHELHCSEAR